MHITKIYKKLEKFPFGKHLFSWIVCYRAPYFKSISPLFEALDNGICIASIKNKKRIHNHIGTIHAIAVCNLAEAVAGLYMEASIPSHLRWIPKGMHVEYLKKTPTDLIARCEQPADTIKLGVNTLTIHVFDTSEEVVLTANIDMHVSQKVKRRIKK